MYKRFIFSLILSIGILAAAAQSVYAVPVRTYGSVAPDIGKYILKSENAGNGNFAPNSSVSIDSYLFQCKSAGTDACSTQHINDAALVQKWQNYVTVPQLNSSSSEIKHNIGALPYGQCGRIQYDQGVVGIDGAIGGWVYNFGKDCDGATNQTSTCSAQQPINTQFRLSGNGGWVSGNDMTGLNLKTGQQIDVNCFAKNGSALLAGGVIDMRKPDGTVVRASSNAELRNLSLTQVGQYSFTCSSTTIASCSDADALSVTSLGTATPTPLPTPVPTPIPTPLPTPRVSPTPSPTPHPQVSTCDSLQVVGGNNSHVPAKVTRNGTNKRTLISVSQWNVGVAIGL